MGQEARSQAISEIPLNLTREEMQTAKERFNLLDKDRKGHITVNDIRRHFREHNNKIDERLLHELLNEVDLNKNGELELAEFFQVRLCTKRCLLCLLVLAVQRTERRTNHAESTAALHRRTSSVGRHSIWRRCLILFPFAILLVRVAVRLCLFL
jgi:hypothetical protein